MISSQPRVFAAGDEVRQSSPVLGGGPSTATMTRGGHSVDAIIPMLSAVEILYLIHPLKLL